MIGPIARPTDEVHRTGVRPGRALSGARGAARPLARVAQLRQLRRAAEAADPGFDRRENMLAFPNAFSGAIEPWLAGLNAVAHDTEARRWLLARAVEPFWGHALEHIWGLACGFLGLEIAAPRRIGLATCDEDQRRADALLRSHGLGAGFVVLCPFAAGVFEGQDKVWPGFAEFAGALHARGIRLVCCPGPGESEQAATRFPGVLRLDDLSLGAYGGVLRRASLVVANDTGPGHLAAAVGAPTLSVLGPTVPEQWAPWGPNVKVLREWPRWPTVDEALAAALGNMAFEAGATASRQAA